MAAAAGGRRDRGRGGRRACRGIAGPIAGAALPIARAFGARSAALRGENTGLAMRVHEMAAGKRALEKQVRGPWRTRTAGGPRRAPAEPGPSARGRGGC